MPLLATAVLGGGDGLPAGSRGLIACGDAIGTVGAVRNRRAARSALALALLLFGVILARQLLDA